MPRISAITTCKGRLEHLRQTLPTLLAVPGLEVIVVDYDCPDGAGEWTKANHPQAKVVAVRERPFFNLSAARNLGAAAARGEWLLFVDADTLVAPSFADTVAPLLKPGFFYFPEPRPAQLWGCVVVQHADFDRTGGYDEVFEGWGSEDVDMIERLMFMGCREAGFPQQVVSMITHGPELRARFQELDFDLGAAVNAFYRVVKNDLLRHNVILDLAARRSLRADVLRTFSSPKPVHNFQVNFRETPLDSILVKSALRYEIGWRKPR